MRYFTWGWIIYSFITVALACATDNVSYWTYLLSLMVVGYMLLTAAVDTRSDTVQQ